MTPGAPEPGGAGPEGGDPAAPAGRRTQPEEPFRSGFVSLLGRPNVGKSTLLNRIVGTKVSIVSDKPQTTRNRVVGVLHRPDAQLVFVDTPGIHKPVTRLGERCNAAATATIGDVDVTCLVVDATAPVGRGDAWVAERLRGAVVVVVNKVDIASRAQVLSQLAAAAELPGVGDAEVFPVSARTGAGVDELVGHLVSVVPPGPRYYPEGMVTDLPDPVRVAELVREQLLARVREELPYSIATRTTDWDWPRIRVEILVERESQKPIVIGRRGRMLAEVGSAVRRQLPPGAYLELHVKVLRDWQRREGLLRDLGYGT